jgi:hypothetical protein
MVGKITAGHPLLGKTVQVDHFQLSSQEFHTPTSQARQKAVRADLRLTLLLSKEQSWYF